MANCITVRGKEYPLALTVQAFAEIGEACPGRDIQRLDEITAMPLGDSMILTAKIAVAMSRAAENKRKYEEPGYTPDPLTLDGLVTLSMPEYQDIMLPVVNALKEQRGGQTVRVAAAKGQKKTGDAGAQESS